jgi:hypothetical protein
MTVFGYLASRFGTHPENLATEALTYVLDESSSVRDAVGQLVRRLGVDVGELRYRSQVWDASDSAIPDLVGLDDQNRSVLIGEMKFWAGLTANQPSTYLRRLPAGVPGVLLFVAPSRRLEPLWHELARRCSDDGVVLTRTVVAEELWYSAANGDHVLGLVSWRHLLNAARAAADSAADLAAAADLIQLQGLCDQQDSTAFLPLLPDELTGSIGLRVQHFCQLVSDLAAAGEQSGLLDNTGLREGGTRGEGEYVRYTQLVSAAPGRRGSKWPAWIAFSPRLWHRTAATPIWIFMGGAVANYRSLPEAVETLSSLTRLSPPKLLTVEGSAYVPLYLRVGAERREVLDDLVRQVAKIVDLI